MSMQGSVTVFLGPPGIGKGTQAKILVEKLGMVHLSSGDVLRHEISNDTDLGRQMQAAGNGVDPDLLDQLMMQALEKRLAQIQDQNIILDGFPRSKAQVEWLDECLAQRKQSLKHVIEFYGDENALIERITGRYSCANKKCQAIYHDSRKPTRIANCCDVCGSTEFSRRQEDGAEFIADRFISFHRGTKSMIDYYVSYGLVRRINGLAPLEDVTMSLIKLF